MDEESDSMFNEENPHPSLKALHKREELNNEDIWKVLNHYFKQHGLVSQ